MAVAHDAKIFTLSDFVNLIILLFFGFFDIPGR